MRNARPSAGALACVCLAAFLTATLLLPFSAEAGWQQGRFRSEGGEVVEFHCVPERPGRHPAVILLHGASPPGAGYRLFEKMCSELAAAGYYAEFIEFYSQTGGMGPGQQDKLRRSFPTWLAEIHSGISNLQRNPKVDGKRIGLMGFSLGAFLSLWTGASHPGQLAAIVEYYGGIPEPAVPFIKNLPPVLIIHGDKDVVVPVAKAKQLDELLSESNLPHEIRIYPGANHAFNFPGIAPWYNPAYARDAWERSLTFLRKHLRPGPKASVANKPSGPRHAVRGSTLSAARPNSR